LNTYGLKNIDCVIVDLYPFEETLLQKEATHQTIIEKIDIGGIALIRAAAKNYERTLIIPSQNEYDDLLYILEKDNGETDETTRGQFAARAFDVSSHYDMAIYGYLREQIQHPSFKASVKGSRQLRYGENPHQEGRFYGQLEDLLHKLNGKALSYNNLVDIDAAFHLMREFKDDAPTFAVLKHTNPCGVATRDTVSEAWEDALAGDPVSAFGGILICNAKIDLETAEKIRKLFYEVLIAPDYEDAALDLLKEKKKRIILQLKSWQTNEKQFKSLLNGVIEQDVDLKSHVRADWKLATKHKAKDREMEDLMFANKVVKHLKSNTIALVKGEQLIGMGCGQTSRVDALNQAIHKARNFDFEIQGAVMASDAFFPFPDCVEIADKVGIKAIVQPGGSIKDQDSVDYCDEHGQAMYMTGYRHFKH
jgi:phosphoribosylaminoimidazolecarboxamide formyltransferase/IMP cyclohydrolase